MWWVAGMVGWAHHTAGMEPAAQPHRDLHLCSAVCRRRASRTLTGTVASSPCCCLSTRGLPGLYNGHRGTVTNSTGGGGVVEYQLPLQHLLNLTAPLMFKFKDAQAGRQQPAFVNQGSI